MVKRITKQHNTDTYFVSPQTVVSWETLGETDHLLKPIKVSVLEMAEGLNVSDLVKLETEGVVMYDAHLRTDVLVMAPVLIIIGDNPRASELLLHMGGTANKYCRMCMVSTPYIATCKW